MLHHSANVLYDFIDWVWTEQEQQQCLLRRMGAHTISELNAIHQGQRIEYRARWRRVRIVGRRLPASRFAHQHT